MERPFRFIEYKNTHRDEFQVTEGRQPTFAFFYLKEGSFRLVMDGSETVIRAGDVAIFSDDVDFVRSVIEPISFVYLKFIPNPKCPFAPALPLGRITLRDRERFLQDMARYETMSEAQDPRSVYLREHILEDILLRISDAYIADKGVHVTDGIIGDCHDPLVLQAVQYIRAHVQDKLSMNALCREISTNPTTLNFKFRRALSRSVGECITAERMRAARRLLTNTTFAIGAVAERCGYENIYYFSTVFRKYHGCAPSVYRKQLRG